MSKYEWEEIDPRVGFARFWLPKNFGVRVRKVPRSEKQDWGGRWEAHGVIHFTEGSRVEYTVDAFFRSSAIDGIEDWLRRTARVEYEKRVTKKDPFEYLGP